MIKYLLSTLLLVFISISEAYFVHASYGIERVQDNRSNIGINEAKELMIFVDKENHEDDTPVRINRNNGRLVGKVFLKQDFISNFINTTLGRYSKEKLQGFNVRIHGVYSKSIYYSLVGIVKNIN